MTNKNSNVVQFSKNNVGTINSEAVVESALPDGKTVEEFQDAAVFVDYVREHIQVNAQTAILDFYQASEDKPVSMETMPYSLGGNTTGQVFLDGGKIYDKVTTTYKSEAMLALMERTVDIFSNAIEEIDI